ncbi:pelargonidin 3-O-(6-caffeoylglucoside) 5-O-(6-O-malonylglucoside) 4'''-malonyltransferase-like [Heracleum sosnowskyi]|uniref:Pelargonidin 3-O-(6-caffeoylglucoside) 5-O-(6-O-malonylglucoside) 4'''-malonyltransferase-like n=1 Tax=Heracleum sosnowskyi TaxID=360622 RepID=A0AAD8H440_9APIA|nr:pelargonidin 3-O-(6-caffeoylglucoside) 5-O-(6-O-malonylglucoside) 4'''-malonyltransferase-like [Heracleum sosnowskyi]
MKVQILTRELVKPLIPTPNLRNHKISFTDELAPIINFPIILYYQANQNFKATSMSDILKTSVEKALPKFYPLAGRYEKTSRFIDCSDQGVEFVTAQADSQLMEILGLGKKLEVKLVDQLVPCDVQVPDEITDPLLYIQVTMFACGGLALTLCFAHRIGDASTINAFMAGMVAVSHGLSIEAFSPSFDVASFYPRKGLPHWKLNWTDKNVTKRFVFNSEAIQTLRNQARPTDDIGKSKPSRVQLVSAVIWQALVSIDSGKYGRSRATYFIQTINLREKASPPIPKQSFGNLFGLATVNLGAGEAKDKGYGDYAGMLNDSVKGAFVDYKNMLLHQEDGHRKVIDPFLESNEKVTDPEVNWHMHTSWSRFPYFDADFGWGTPIWASTASLPLKNFCTLLDTKDRKGIEAWVYLEETDMPLFEQHPDILALTGGVSRIRT